MKERPILFSGEMVRALLAGRKTQTRRIGKCQKDDATELGVEYVGHATKGKVAVATYRAFPNGGTARWGLCECSYGKPGDRLWVRETWGVVNSLDNKAPRELPKDIPIITRADSCHPDESSMMWRPSIFMPRWASRITLEVVGVRAERLQEISEADASAEGVAFEDAGDSRLYRDYSTSELVFHLTPVKSYKTLWESIHGKSSWALNPWVWVIEFKRLDLKSVK